MGLPEPFRRVPAPAPATTYRNGVEFFEHEIGIDVIAIYDRLYVPGKGQILAECSFFRTRPSSPETPATNEWGAPRVSNTSAGKGLGAVGAWRDDFVRVLARDLRILTAEEFFRPPVQADFGVRPMHLNNWRFTLSRRMRCQ